MKKIDKLRVTLLGFLVCLMSMSLMAQRVTMDFTTNGWGLPEGSSAGITASTPYTNADGYTITLAASNKFYYNNDGYLMLGKSGSTLTLPAFDFVVERIEIVGTSGASESVKQNIYVGDAAVSTETTGAKNVTNVYQIADAYQAAGNVYTIKVTSAHNTQISTINIYEASAPAAVADPTFTPAAGMFYAAQEVTLACATEGATIYYSMDDGATPYLLYNDPINITEAVTLKAFAVLGEDTSAVTAAEYTFPVDANTIAALKATGIPNTIYKLAEDVIVIYQNGDYLFVQDEEDAAVVVYGNVAKTYNPGDVIADGFFGKYKIYNNLNELVPVEGAPAFPDGVAGTAVEPIVATVDTVLNNYTTWEAKLVKFENVVFTDATHFAQGEDTLVIYNQFGTSFDITPGSVANVTGLVVKYKSNVQIYPRTNADVEILSVPAAELPYRVDFDEYVDENLVIDNGTYTNKWYVGQAQDFDNNKLYISSSNGRTNKYNNEVASEVTVSRDLVIPANGAIVSFDCRYKGADGDYLRFEVSNAVEHSVLKVENTNNEWENVTLSIPSEMAGVVTISFVWENNDNGGEQYPAAIDNIYIYESSCSQPAALSTTIDTTSATTNATIAWFGNADAYLLQYKLANHSEWYSVNTNDTTVTLTNLQGNSNYDVRVQSVCGDDASAWVEGNFEVGCQSYITVPGEKIVGTGNSSTYNAPFNNYFKYSWNECIYPASEFNGPTTINSISWNCASSDALTFSSLKIYMGTRTSETYASTSDWTPENALQLVYVGTNVRVGASTGWQEFILNTPFEYNGTGNLVVVVAKKQSSYSSSLNYYYTNESNTCLYRQTDSYESYADYPGTNTGTRSYRANIKLNMMVSSCGDVEACPAVTNVQVNNITPNSAELTWNRGNESETNFKVEYYAEGSTDVVSVLVEDTAYTLSDLAQLTNYTVKVQALCGENNTSEPVEIEFATPGICPAVSDIQSSNAANTTTLTWTRGGEETAWLVQFKPAAAGDNEWISINVNSLPTTTFGGLMATTDYDVRVKALCDPADVENQSAWSTTYEFISGCAAFDIPFAETFDSNNMPDCWDADGFGFSGGYAYSDDLDAWMMTPAINIPSDEATYLAFDVKGYGNFSVMASYRGTDASRFAEIYSGEIESNSNYTQVVIPMADNLKGRQVYFKIVNNADQYQYIDNLSVDYCPFVPAGLTVSNITENSATLAWTANEAVNNFQVKVGENIIDVEGAKTYTLTGLDASTSYTFSVRTQCGEDLYGDWSAEAEFTTACPSATLPLFESFESNNCPAECWTIIYGSDENRTTNPMTHSTEQYFDGNQSFRFSSYSQLYYNENYTQYLISPELANHGELLLTFDYKKYSSGSEEFRVGYSTTTNNIDAFTWGSDIIDATTSWKEYTQTLPAEVKYIAINYNSYYQYYLYIDNFNVVAAPTCGVPTIAVNGTIATITRGSIGTPASYDLQIGDVIQTVQATETSVNLTTIFTTLAPNTEYAVSVRANCGDEDQSTWSAPVNFTTPCAALALPYTEDFNSYPAVTSTTPPNDYPNHTMPDCWSFLNMSTSTGSYPQMFLTSYSIYSVSGNCLFFKSSSTTPAFAVLPAFATPIEQLLVSFTYRNEGVSSSNGTLYLGYMSNPADANTFVPVYTCSQTTTKTDVEKIFANVGVTGTNYYIAFKYTGGSYNNYYASIDNVVVETIPFCVTPSIASVVPGTTDATVTVAASEHAQSYEVVCVLHGEDIETGTPVAAEELTATITGLTPATQYDVYARAICSETETSDWSDAYSFFTECAAVALPYTENFDSYTSSTTVSSSTMPICWSRLYTGTSTSYGAGIYPSTSYSRSGANSLRFYNYGYGTSASYGDAYAILPEMAADINILGMELYARKYSSSSSSNFEVGVVTDVNDPANSFVTVQTIAPTSTNYEKFEVSFAEYTGANGHIAFRMLKPSSTTYAYIDDITVDVIPTCGVPTLAVSGITATITPSTVVAGTPESYEVLIGEEIQAVTEDSFTITDVFTNLVYGNTYPMQVRAICGEGDTSAWSTAVDFTYEFAYTMEYGQTREITTCLGTLYDNGGPQSDYQSSSNDVMVIYPASEYSVVRLQGEYNTESISYDYLIIYDGENTSAPQLGKFGGQGGIDVTSTTGPLTVYFRSDGSVNKSGFALNISCKQVVFEKDLAINSIDPIAWACDQSDAKVTINVENAGITDTITSFVACYVINTQVPVYETVNCNLAPGEKMSYTFNATPEFVAGENIVHAIVNMEGDMNAENNYTDPITVSVLEPEAVPYTPTLSADLVNKGWNVVDANNDGITMDINNKSEIAYTFNDELAADDWMFTPCIDMPAGTYNVYYDYKANSSLNEMFEVYYGNGANVAAMTNEVAHHSFNNTDYETAMQTITVAEDGVYNFGFHAMSLAGNLGFNIANFKVYPVIDVTVTSGEHGTVTPNGVVPVNYGENLNLTIVPNTMYHVAGVWVDDVQVMSEDPYNSNFMIYTLENVTEPHNVFVDYKLEYHLIKSVANYNPAYTDVPGEFIPAATDTLIDPDPVTVNFAAAYHYHLYSLEMAMMNEEDMVDVTADVVDNGDHTYYYVTPELVVANYYFKATFRRDTVAVNYLVNTGKGYADASDVLAQGAQYATWWDYSVANDVDAVAHIRPYTTGDAHSDYHIVNVNINDQDMGVLDTYTFENIKEEQNIAIDFGYQVTTSIRNYDPTYLGSDVVRGTITPGTQLVAEGDSTVVTGTVQEHFHLYNLFVDGVDMIDQVVFEGDTFSLTIDSTIANYHIEAVVKIDTFAINYNVLAGRGYADQSDLLIAPATYSTIVNYGDDFLTNLVPAEGFRIENVVVDGVNMYTAPNYQYNFITESHNIDVTFTPNTYTVTVNAYGQGTVSDNLTFVYDPENPMNYDFFATPAEGYHIEAMYLNGEVMEDMPEFAREGFTAVIEDVHENMTFDVHFAINTYTVDVTANAGGTTNIQGTVSYNYGENVTVTATAEEGRYIQSISVDGDVTNYTQADNMTVTSIDFPAIHENHEVIVVFDVQKFSIVGSIDATANQGTINYASSFAAVLDYGGHTTLNFQPNANYQVADVVVDGQSVGAVDSYEFVNVTANHEVVVSFGPVMYTLTATSNVPSCTITPATTTVQAGENVNYTMTVANGYHLLNVIANGQEIPTVNNTFIIENVQSDYTISANFAPNNVTVTVAQPEHATITPGTMTYAYGATPTYVIMPQAGYEVVSVTAGGAVVPVTYNNGVGTFTLAPVTADITLTATTAIKTFTITATQSAHGTISPAPVQTVNYGGNVTYTITPEQFYAISDVKVDGASRGAISSYTFNNVTGNHTIEALFEAACYEPTNLTAMDITTTSAVLSWVGTAPSYEVRYRKAADANWNTQTVTVPTVTLTGLDSNTLYAWEVRAYCTAQLQSEWVANSFMTKAGAQPYDPTSIASAEFNTVKVYSHLNNVYVVNENGVAISSIAIFDINGKQVYTGSVNGSTEVISLNVANGSYIVRLASENGVGIYKVSIVR